MTTQQQIIESNQKTKDQALSLLNTLSEYAEQNIQAQDSIVPVVGLDEDGKLSLFDSITGNLINPFAPLASGATVEKVIVQKEIIVSSDSSNKQTVQELDFNIQDFVADRDDDPSILRISLKNRPDFNIFVGDNDPSLTTEVSQGNMWLYSILGKMYVRYQNFWIQPHPE